MKAIILFREIKLTKSAALLCSIVILGTTLILSPNANATAIYECGGPYNANIFVAEVDKPAGDYLYGLGECLFHGDQGAQIQAVATVENTAVADGAFLWFEIHKASGGVVCALTGTASAIFGPSPGNPCYLPTTGTYFVLLVVDQPSTGSFTATVNLRQAIGI